MASGRERVCAMFWYVLVQVQVWILLKATETRQIQTGKHLVRQTKVKTR